MPDLSGKVVVVTGAARGIGAAASQELARQGARVVVTARSLDAAKALADDIVASGGEALALACDVADASSVDAMVAATRAKFGRIDALVNNAGVIDPVGRIVDTDPAAWMRAVEINLVGSYLAARAVIPAMIEAGGGTIVNLSSGAAFRPMEGWSAYCSTKAGLAMFTRSIDLEYGAAGVVSIGLSPGVVDTGMQGQIRASGINPVSQIPRENLTDPKEPGLVIAFLCSEAGRSYAGKEVDLRDPALREAVGLSATAA
ncbi:SDR family NAD(P)-dependent oxidoreductase [Arvimicrobium flavum]|uniref:SDR family NAD(P)-dependent oxidoreductase n=1 Tax=Arvimicrobium flavum TaxID=3393320 RepID=UPI00237A2934|nr:SDR family oxidoreductase [Mesorhizobium shangrilense]